MNKSLSCLSLGGHFWSSFSAIHKVGWNWQDSISWLLLFSCFTLLIPLISVSWDHFPSKLLSPFLYPALHFGEHLLSKRGSSIMSRGSGPLPLLKWQIPFISCFQTCVLQRCLKFHFHHVIRAQCSHLSRFTMMPWRWWCNWGSCGLNCISVMMNWQRPTVGCWMCAAVHVKVNHFWGFLITVTEVIKKIQTNKYIPGIQSHGDLLQERVSIWKSSCNHIHHLIKLC